MRVKSCADCIFWHRPEGGLTPDDPNPSADVRAWWSQAGECRRHAPGVTLGRRIAQWHVTSSAGWCGDGDDGNDDDAPAAN